MFLLPLAAAAAGAVVAGGGRTQQFCGAMVGLLIGLATGVLGARLIGRAPKEKS
jgi:NhaP-type Na+/H+ or K+/H+ antiporter